MVLVRLFYGVLVVLAVSVLIFAGVQLLPGNAATAILGQSATPDAIRELNLQLGLDKPAVGRYLSWLSGVLHGDFGTSFSTREAISGPLFTRLGNTLFLAGCTAAIAVAQTPEERPRFFAANGQPIGQGRCDITHWDSPLFVTLAADN